MQDAWIVFLDADIGLPMLGGLVTGFLIGLEREVRAKPAGLRTHTLVCFASTLLMLAATRQADWIAEFAPGGSVVADPTRMAHGVLTGIGFLCAGVIFRDGASVHGLTTAASLWVTAALGLLFGMGLYGLAVTGAVSTLLVLVLFRIVSRILPDRIEAAVAVRCDPDESFDAASLRRLLDERRFRTTPIAQRLSDGGRRLDLAVVVTLRGESEIERLGALLATLPCIDGFQIVPTEDMAPHAAAWG